MLKIGIIGAGSMGVAHAKAYQTAGVQVTQVFDVNQSAAKALAEEYGAQVSASVESLISSDIDAVSICLPHHLHYEASLYAAQMGKPTLLEKPVDISLQKGTEIVEAFRDANTHLMIGFITRFYRSQIYLKKLIQSGYFGQVRMVVEHLAAGGHGLPKWYSERRKAGGGIMMMGISHTIDRVAWLLEDVVESTYAQFHPDTYQGDVEDMASATLTYANGTLLSVSACRSTLKEHPREHQCRIYGVDAEATIDFGLDHEQHITVLGKNGTEEQIIVDDDPFLHLIGEFVASIYDKRAPQPSGDDGLHSLSAIESIYRSARTGQAQSIDKDVSKN